MSAFAISRFAAVAAVVLTVAPVHAQQGGAEDAVLAVPNVALTFAPGYLAEDMGLFAKRKLNVKSVVIAGIGSANAVISGSADFAQYRGRRSPALPRVASACSRSRARSTGRPSRS
jgi:ABC-type nitrate/sulfonate/bicarbonate transport system substrate-binding protein